MKNSLKILFFASLLLINFGCNFFQNRKNYSSVNALIHDSIHLQKDIFLKAHLKNGEVVLFRGTWDYNELESTISGQAIRYNFNRKPVEEGLIAIHIEDVAIFETNEKPKRTPDSGRITAMSIMAAGDIALGIFCIVNPKACFGSCPTFYLNAESTVHACDAEAFSNAISPSLEYEDIDALQNYMSTSSALTLTMKNEALETHCIKSLRLYAIPRDEHQRVFQSRKNVFYLTEKIIEVSKATAPEGDVTDALKYADAVERFSLSDPDNMMSKEEIYIEFDAANISSLPIGLVINFRQSLMTTYLIYSALGYMGDQVGDFFAMIESDAAHRQTLRRGIYEHLGDIEIYLWDEVGNEWIPQGGFYETGPIAINQQFLPLSIEKSGKNIKLKIVQNRGLWRLDYVALAQIIREVSPVILEPDSIIYRNKVSEELLEDLKDSNKYMISFPGDVFTLFFDLKTEGYRDIFLASRGYYIEWMRSNWFKEKNLSKLRKMFYEPERYLRDEAKQYKRYEMTMEREFWNSRITTNQIP